MPLQLLVIEDRMSDFELIEQQLERQGVAAACCRVDCAEDLEAALAGGPWDAVLTDYNIPGMAFQNTVSRVRTLRPDLPIVLVSGYMGEDQAAMLFDAGITDFVLKYRPARLGATIRRAVANAEAQQARREAEVALRDSAQQLEQALAEVRAANERLEKDTLVPARRAWAGRYSAELLDTVDWCMRLDHMERPQSVFTLQKALLGEKEPERRGEAAPERRAMLDQLKGWWKKPA